LFTGTRHVSAVPLAVGLRERLAILSLAALIFGGALFPQPGVASRNHAAERILQQRGTHFPGLADSQAEPQLLPLLGAPAASTGVDDSH
jgi:NADH-quinone oxidoreductase subunit M